MKFLHINIHYMAEKAAHSFFISITLWLCFAVAPLSYVLEMLPAKIQLPYLTLSPYLLILVIVWMRSVKYLVPLGNADKRN